MMPEGSDETKRESQSQRNLRCANSQGPSRSLSRALSTYRERSIFFCGASEYAAARYDRGLA